jgi:hypothetical protein
VLLDQFICSYSQSPPVLLDQFICAILGPLFGEYLFVLFSGPFLVSIYLWVPSESTSVTRSVYLFLFSESTSVT